MLFALFRRAGRGWPWLVLALTVIPAVWHYVDFAEDLDREYPRIIRPTFSPRPPAAYRLAEAGDTLDHLSLYAGSVAIVLAATGWGLTKRRTGLSQLWPAALAIALAATWQAATTGPDFDDWPSLGWKSILDPRAHVALRIGLVLAGVALSACVVGPIWRSRHRLAFGSNGLFVLAIMLMIAGLFRIPGVEPVDYWPRWLMFFGLLAFGMGLARILPTLGLGRQGLLLRTAGLAGVALLIVGGLRISWYQRPLERLKVIEPGRLYISAMPTPDGLAESYRRHEFKTIINLFAEELDQHPKYLDEVMFATQHGVRYLNSPADPDQADAFLDETLRVACDPDSWPVLVHCHGCMDRTPAWLGIYRFVHQGRPLDEIMREIEQHRGYRPKASVSLLYNWALPRLAPERYAGDPAAQLLRERSGGRTLYRPAADRVARRP